MEQELQEPVSQEQVNNQNVLQNNQSDSIQGKQEDQQQNNKDIVFHIKDYDSDKESVWSDSSDDELDRQKVREMYEREMKMNKRIGEDDNIVSENYKSKNEILYQEKVKKLKQIAESTEDRQKRFGINFKGDEVMIKIGEVAHIMDDTIIVQSQSPETRQEENGIEKVELSDGQVQIKNDILDLDNLLFTQDKEIIGLIEDVIGSVKNPLYQILTDKYLENMVNEDKLKSGDPVFVIQGMNKILLKVQITQLMQQKGCDASNQNDEEILQENDRFYSDDEQEQHSHPKLKNQKRKMRQEDLEEEVDNLDEKNDIDNEDEEQKVKGQQIRAKQQQQNQNNNKNNNNQKKKIMLFKMVNGKLEKVFVKPSQFEKIKNDPKNKIQTYSNLNELPVPPTQINNNKYQPNQNNNGNNNYHNNFNQNKPYFNNRQQQHNYNKSQNQQKLNMMFPQVNLLGYNPQNVQNQQPNFQFNPQQQNIFQNMPNFNNNNNNNNITQQNQQLQQQQYFNNQGTSNPIQSNQNHNQQNNNQPLDQNNLSGMSVEQLQQLALMANQLASQKQQNQ